MKLPSMIKGWLNPQMSLQASPESLLTNYISTGNNRYLTLLVEQFNRALYHYLLTQSDKETAEDILQLMWLKVINNKAGLTTHSNVKSWLYIIARNTLIDELRRQKKWQCQPLEDHELTSNNLEGIINADNKLMQFDLALKQLSFYQREAFIFQQEGFSVMEICQLTEQNFETIKTRLRYARVNLKKLLGTHL